MIGCKKVLIAYKLCSNQSFHLKTAFLHFPAVSWGQFLWKFSLKMLQNAPFSRAPLAINSLPWCSQVAECRRVPSLYRTEQQTGWSKVGIMVLGSNFSMESWLVGLSVGGDPGFEDLLLPHGMREGSPCWKAPLLTQTDSQTWQKQSIIDAGTLTSRATFIA